MLSLPKPAVAGQSSAPSFSLPTHTQSSRARHRDRRETAQAPQAALIAAGPFLPLPLRGNATAAAAPLPSPAERNPLQLAAREIASSPLLTTTAGGPR